MDLINYGCLDLTPSLHNATNLTMQLEFWNTTNVFSEWTLTPADECPKLQLLAQTCIAYPADLFRLDTLSSSLSKNSIHPASDHIHVYRQYAPADPSQEFRILTTAQNSSIDESHLFTSDSPLLRLCVSTPIVKDFWIFKYGSVDFNRVRDFALNEDAENG